MIRSGWFSIFNLSAVFTITGLQVSDNTRLLGLSDTSTWDCRGCFCVFDFLDIYIPGIGAEKKDRSTSVLPKCARQEQKNKKIWGRTEIWGCLYGTMSFLSAHFVDVRRKDSNLWSYWWTNMAWIKDTKDEQTWLQRLSASVLKKGPIPKHVAFIMDGNRRFAKKNSMDRAQGHLMGFDKLAQVSHFLPFTICLRLWQLNTAHKSSPKVCVSRHFFRR